VFHFFHSLNVHDTIYIYMVVGFFSQICFLFFVLEKSLLPYFNRKARGSNNIIYFLKYK